MRRDPRLINLYDKPLQRRPLVARSTSAPSGFGTAILGSIGIVLTTAAFFWIYDAVAHSRTPFVPPTHVAAHTQAEVLRLPPPVPAPDMRAPEVRRAEADVPPPPVAEARGTEEKKPAEKKPAVAASAHKKKVIRTAKHLPAQARQAFAAGTWFHGPMFGGF